MVYFGIRKNFDFFLCVLDPSQNVWRSVGFYYREYGYCGIIVIVQQCGLHFGMRFKVSLGKISL